MENGAGKAVRVFGLRIFGRGDRRRNDLRVQDQRSFPRDLRLLEGGRAGQHGQAAAQMRRMRRIKFQIVRRSIRLVTGPYKLKTQKVMKKDIHPGNYRFVVFRDMSNGTAFLTRSSAPSRETVKWEDGKEYPLIKLEISNTSHPFFTGKNVLVDTAGRIDKFNKPFETLLKAIDDQKSKVK